MSDWRNETDYPGEETSPEEWTWEFMRRNLNYQRDYSYVNRRLCEIAKTPKEKEPCEGLPYSDDARKLYFDPPRNSGESVSDWVGRCVLSDIDPKWSMLSVGYGGTWGLHTMYDPSKGFNQGVKFLEDYFYEYPKIIDTFDQLDGFAYADDYLDPPPCDWQ